MSGEVVFKAIIDRCVGEYENGFRIYACQPTDKEVKLKYNKYGNVSISGEVHELTIGQEYTITGVESKYGYDIKHIFREKPTSLDQSKKFLCEIISPTHAEALLEVYPDIIDMIMNNQTDDIDLSNVKGVKEKKFEKIKEKVMENFVLMDFINDFANYNMTLGTAKKMYETFSSIEVMREQMKEDPYSTLCLIGGIGFKKADSLILSLKENQPMRKSLQRAKACLKFVLSENEKNGNTWISLDELIRQSNSMIPESIDFMIEALKSPDIKIDKPTKRIAFLKTFNVEKFIATTLLEAIQVKRQLFVDVSKFYRVDGFELGEEQKQILSEFCKNNVNLLVGNAGCVDKDTEFFNGYEWKKISEYQEGDRVLQYTQDGKAELVYPQRYIKKECEEFNVLKSQTGAIDQLLSDEHNIVYQTSKGNLAKKSFKEFEVMHNNSTRGFQGGFLTTFNYNGDGISLTNEEIELMCAIICDGYFPNSTNRCIINLKKERRKIELENLLNRCDIEFDKRKSVEEGYHVYSFIAPRKEKEFGKDWYNCNSEQLQVIGDNILKWDGHIDNKGRKSFSTTIKQTADFIQFVFSALGYRSTIGIDDRVGQEHKSSNGKTYSYKSITYDVHIDKNKNRLLKLATKNIEDKVEIKRVKSEDGFKYCFTVDSGMLVLRRNDRIFITGNSGKTASMKAIIALCDFLGLSYTLATPTGKSAIVLGNSTKRESGTIHRQLGYNPAEGWGFNKENKIPTDVVIIDENGMTDIWLMKHLLEAVDINKTMILFVQDDAQLPSVGAGNCAYDFIRSGMIPTTRLNQIFRYGEGGLLQVVTKIRKGEKYLEDNNEVQIFGANKDYVFIPSADQYVGQYVVSVYKQLLGRGVKPEQIMVLSGKNVHENGTIDLNQRLQKNFNPHADDKAWVKYGDTIFRLGDMVMQISNNYKAENDKGEFVTITNGEIGKIVEVGWNKIYVEFDRDTIVYDKGDLGDLLLAYSISVHKSQGSSIDYVIMASPSTHVFTSNKNILYVGLTRARIQAYHISTVRSVNSIIVKSAELQRNTFMIDLLQGKIA